MLGGVMLARLESVVAEFGLEIQSGGVKGRGGMDAIFTLKQVLSKRRQHGQDTWGAFVDLKKAFPSIPRHVLFCVLRMFGVPPHFIQVLKRFYTDLVMQAVCELVEPLWKGALPFRTCLDRARQTVRASSE